MKVDAIRKILSVAPTFLPRSGLECTVLELAGEDSGLLVKKMLLLGKQALVCSRLPSGRTRTGQLS